MAGGSRAAEGVCVCVCVWLEKVCCLDEARCVCGGGGGCEEDRRV